MQVIPVIDLKGKQVVHAKMGERHLYAPIATPLAVGSAPRDVIRGFLSVAAFRIIYIADLDAIEGGGGHDDVLADLQSAFPGVTFWVDAGIKSLTDARAWLTRNSADLVVGSESFEDAKAFAALRDEPRIILSLDFRGEVFQGPVRLLDEADLWPRRLIVMTLSRVGSDAGPDFERLNAIFKQAGARAVYAAGGLRGKDDLRLLQETGAAGVLVASALHDGRVGAADLVALEGFQ
jgi:phosphoribosylformimino-5-aminoimidazole carboxamide ribotide isomerase